MLKVVIIDDELNAREVIASIIKKHCAHVNIVADADSVQSGISIIEQHKPDIVFLDIHMHDGSGFDLLRKLKSIDFKIIFITAFEEYAVKAFKFSALDYLLKPVEAEDLVTAIKKAEELIQQQDIYDNLEAFKSNYFSKNKESKKLILKTLDSVYVINFTDIVRCESDGCYTKFFLNNSQKIMVSTILKEYDEMLTEYGFFRIHQSHLINLDYFMQFKKNDGGFVIMKDGTHVPVSSRKKELLMQVLEKL